jgi:hypothetical protein
MSVASQIRRSSMLISVKGKVKNQLQLDQESMGGCTSDVQMFFPTKSLTKPTGALEHCREDSPIYKEFPSDRIPKATKGVIMYISLFTVLQFTSCKNSCKLHQRITVIYTGELQ